MVFYMTVATGVQTESPRINVVCFNLEKCDQTSEAIATLAGLVLGVLGVFLSGLKLHHSIVYDECEEGNNCVLYGTLVAISTVFTTIVVAVSAYWAHVRYKHIQASYQVA